MKKHNILKIVAATMVLASCSKESPELLPCMCDGSESTLGLFDCMCEPMKKKPVRRISYIQDEQPKQQTLMINQEQRDAYIYLHQRRDTFAPVKLEYVDFRIKKGRKYDEFDTKLGNYRFRIFGCRRESKNVFLNQGRAMQKDMHFFDIFYEQMNEYYPVVVDKTNPYYMESDKVETPEYIVTAEITDYFMNICDEFDWDNVKQKKLRSGSSEMTVTWRVMNLVRDEVYCKGTTTGYGQISEGEPKGETLLVERAFEDALNKLPEIECFNKTLAQRIRPEDLQQQLAYLRDLERRSSSFKSQYDKELKGISLLQECATGIGSQGRYIDEDGNVIGSGGRSYRRVVDGRLVEADECPLEDNSCEETIVIADNEIDERSGVSGKGGVIDLNGGTDGSGSATKEGATAIIRDRNHNGKLAALEIDQRCRAIEINDDSCTVVKNMKENVTIADDYWIDVPLNKTEPEAVANRLDAEKSFSSASNRFCIKNHAPYENLNAQNLYTVRASVVAVENANGQKGAGLIIADNLILTSADLIVKDNNNFNITTVNGKKFTAGAFRVNPNKNVALLLLEQPTQYTPLPLSLDLPEVNKDIMMTLGLLDFENEGEGYLDNNGKVIGYRWSEDRGAEIIVDTFVQSVSLGGALIDKNGNIVGLAHESKKTEDGPDLFIPIETALKSLGLEICGREFTNKKPAAIKTYETPLADAIDNSTDKSPKAMSGKERK